MKEVISVSVRIGDAEARRRREEKALELGIHLRHLRLAFLCGPNSSVVRIHPSSSVSIRGSHLFLVENANGPGMVTGAAAGRSNETPRRADGRNIKDENLRRAIRSG